MIDPESPSPGSWLAAPLHPARVLSAPLPGNIEHGPLRTPTGFNFMTASGRCFLILSRLPFESMPYRRLPAMVSRPHKKRLSPSPWPWGRILLRPGREDFQKIFGIPFINPHFPGIRCLNLKGPVPTRNSEDLGLTPARCAGSITQ